jgi:hypothetical protein
MEAFNVSTKGKEARTKIPNTLRPEEIVYRRIILLLLCMMRAFSTKKLPTVDLRKWTSS